MKANTNLAGRVAVITGAAHGIGLALALQAADKGMGSMVGVTVVCPETVETNITDIPGYREAGGRPTRDYPLNSLTPEATAEEIFDAVGTRRFRVYAARPLHGMFGSDPSAVIHRYPGDLARAS
jgi:short-subunit dehydrogenase